MGFQFCNLHAYKKNVKKMRTNLRKCQNFVPEDNRKINNKHDNPNKPIIAKNSKWLIKPTCFNKS